MRRLENNANMNRTYTYLPADNLLPSQPMQDLSDARLDIQFMFSQASLQQIVPILDTPERTLGIYKLSENLKRE